jgi:D-glycero-D-manno-heptose 1,7-bisphosphate phosphatase
MMASQAAVFLDRDGVLIEDRILLVRREEIRVLAGVPQALQALKQAGFLLIVVSNQAVVARGMITEAELDLLHAEMQRLLEEAGSPRLDAVYSCPHHPEATLPEYRTACQCRKPRPGSLLRAAGEHGLDLPSSFMVGDRMTDIVAGSRAGCRTVLIESPQHLDPPIVTVEPLDDSCRPDYRCPDLAAAAAWILRVR